MTNDHRAIDMAAWSLAGLAAGLTLAKVALIMSIIAALCSVVLFGVRIHDRLKYGPPR